MVTCPYDAMKMTFSRRFVFYFIPVAFRDLHLNTVCAAPVGAELPTQRC